MVLLLLAALMAFLVLVPRQHPSLPVRVARRVAVLAAVVLLPLLSLVHFAPAFTVRVFYDLQRSVAGLERHEATLPDGNRIVYLEGGSGDPLILIHGFGANKDNFDLVARSLVGRWHVVVPDLLGFGESSHPQDADYSPAAQAERVRALASVLGLGPKVHLGGSSMGGHISLSWAAAHPGEVASLWLLDSGGIWSGPTSELAATIQRTGVNMLVASNEEEFRRLFQFAMSKPPPMTDGMLDVLAQDRIRNHDLELRIFAQVRGDHLEDRIRGLRVPALIVWGREDRAIHVGTADVLHGLLPDSRVVVLDGIGHLPMIEAPGRVVADYLAFRDGLH